MTAEERRQVDQAARALLEAAAEAKGPQHVLEVAHTFLNKPIMLDDLVFQPIANCLEGLRPEELTGHSNEDPSTFRGWMKTVKTSAEPVIDERGEPYRVMCCDVRIRGAEAAKLSLYETRPFTPLDSELMKCLAQALACVLGVGEAGADRPNQALSNLMLDLIEGRITQERAQQLQGVMGFSLETRHWVLVMRDTQWDPIEYPLIQTRSFHRLGGATVAQGDELICLLEQVPDAAVIESFLGENRLRGGLSRGFSPLTRLRDYFLQAGFALTRAEREEKILVTYDDCLTWDVIACCGRDRDPLTFCRPEVLKLWEYDRANGTDYLDTLECYCENLCSVTETARASFLHFNTIKYRLSNIRKITGMGELNGRDLFEFWLSLRLLDDIKGS